MWKLDGVHRRCYEGVSAASAVPLFVTEPSFIQVLFWGTTIRPVLRCHHSHLRRSFSQRHSAIHGSQFSSVRAHFLLPVYRSTQIQIVDLLRPFLPNPSTRPPNVLELFARTALAGPRHDSSEERGIWLAVGNEAVKFNVLDSEAEGGEIGRASCRERVS